MSIKKLPAFAGACQEAVAAVLDAIGATGAERRQQFDKAKLAIDKALEDSHSSEEWYFADHLRRGIKEVEACSLDAA